MHAAASPRIALVTAIAARALDEDLIPLAAALEALGAIASIADWDDAAIDWSGFDLVLLRSTWDYTLRLPEFLAWIERVATLTRLLNPPEVVRWNTDKHYLGDLARAGVPVVSSTFVEPGADAAAALAAFLAADASRADVVVKPCIGAGSRDAQRHAAAAPTTAVAHMQRLLDAGRSVLLQPYLDRVDAEGETALLFCEGTFSHAIRKGPLLRRGEGPTRALFAPEHIQSRTPGADELAIAGRALAKLPFAPPLLYARVDLLRDAHGQPVVLEFELTEPSLFFASAPGSVERFAAAALARATPRD